MNSSPLAIERLMQRLGKRPKLIYGCDAQGDAGTVYMARYFIFRTRAVNCYLHVFHRSDTDRAMHDHPWSFVSILLWRGYLEHTPDGVRRKLPGMVLYRPAEWTHYVELIDGKPAVSLVFVARKRRDWGFHLDGKWIQWQQFFRDNGCKP
jgi:hypothetical protein